MLSIIQNLSYLVSLQILPPVCGWTPPPYPCCGCLCKYAFLSHFGLLTFLGFSLTVLHTREWSVSQSALWKLHVSSTSPLLLHCISTKLSWCQCLNPPRYTMNGLDTKEGIGNTEVVCSAKLRKLCPLSFNLPMLYCPRYTDQNVESLPTIALKSLRM